MPDIIIVGNDKIGAKFLNQFQRKTDYKILLDKSSSINRVIKLLRKGIIPITLAFKMFYAEKIRKSYKIEDYQSVTTNKELINYIEEYNPSQIFLFRAGLIINKQVIEKGIPLKNVHCAKIPEFGGLGVIQKALDAKVYSQCATMHIVTSKIDEGLVIATEPYELNPDKSYKQNEDIAYDAGINLLNRIL
jgi:folate-dependent phosphoribosylglycinamide formyltransferase PurN